MGLLNAIKHRSFGTNDRAHLFFLPLWNALNKYFVFPPCFILQQYTFFFFFHYVIVIWVFCQCLLSLERVFFFVFFLFNHDCQVFSWCFVLLCVRLDRKQLINIDPWNLLLPKSMYSWGVKWKTDTSPLPHPPCTVGSSLRRRLNHFYTCLMFMF